MSVRRPAVAGYFYPASPEHLAASIRECFLHELGPGAEPEKARGEERATIALVSPHAGYVYSGPVAAHGYHRLSKEAPPDIVVLIGPNHTGLGAEISVAARGEWLTPLGSVKVNEGVASAIVAECSLAREDDLAHAGEHSLEVQIPFLQTIYERFEIVPIVMMRQDPAAAASLGDAVAKALSGKNALLILSTDFTHYEPQSAAYAKDSLAIDAILALDESKLYEVVKTMDISMCGVGPVMAGIRAAKALGAKRAELLRYATSGDVTGDTSAVVGYASIAIAK